jgi:hypothetical protein
LKAVHLGKVLDDLAFFAGFSAESVQTHVQSPFCDAQMDEIIEIVRMNVIARQVKIIGDEGGPLEEALKDLSYEISGVKGDETAKIGEDAKVNDV